MNAIQELLSGPEPTAEETEAVLAHASGRLAAAQNTLTKLLRFSEQLDPVYVAHANYDARALARRRKELRAAIRLLDQLQLEFGPRDVLLRSRRGLN